MTLDRKAKRVRFTRENIRFAVTPYGLYTYRRDALGEVSTRVPGYIIHKYMGDIDKARRILKTR